MLTEIQLKKKRLRKKLKKETIKFVYLYCNIINIRLSVITSMCTNAQNIKKDSKILQESINF